VLGFNPTLDQSGVATRGVQRKEKEKRIFNLETYFSYFFLVNFSLFLFFRTSKMIVEYF
jgi:hypothetical protein